MMVRMMMLLRIDDFVMLQHFARGRSEDDGHLSRVDDALQSNHLTSLQLLHDHVGLLLLLVMLLLMKMLLLLMMMLLL